MLDVDPMPDEIGFLTANQLLDLYRAKAVSPVEATRVAYERIERYEPKLNAFCYIAKRDESLRLARASEARWRSGTPIGALDGLPITVKDALLAKGWPMLKGSRTSDPNQTWDEDAPAVARARAHGAIILGKTTTPEFNWKGVTDSPLSGITRNPWDLETTAGGSSGGAAAALAAGIGHAAIGSDAGGSLRIPAAFCGLVGYKATVGRVPNYPRAATGSLGHVGPITRTVSDAALMLNIMSEPDARDWLCLPHSCVDFRSDLGRGVRGLKIAFSPTLGYGRVEGEVADVVAKAMPVFEELGGQVEFVEAPFRDPTHCFRIHYFAGIAHSARKLTPAQKALMDPDLLRVIEQAREVDLEAYMCAADNRALLGRNMRLFHQRYDLLVTPTVAVSAFTAGRLAPSGYGDDWINWAPFTYPFNLTGQPAASVPCGFTKKGLPVGLQLVGGMFEDGLVLAAAHAYQTARPTTDVRPRLN